MSCVPCSCDLDVFFRKGGTIDRDICISIFWISAPLFDSPAATLLYCTISEFLAIYSCTNYGGGKANHAYSSLHQTASTYIPCAVYITMRAQPLSAYVKPILQQLRMHQGYNYIVETNHIQTPQLSRKNERVSHT